jgi:hypothetical protein
VGSSLLNFPQNPREFICFPSINQFLIPFDRSLHGALCCPPQIASHLDPGLIVRTSDVEVSSNDYSYSVRNPKIIRPPVGRCALRQ